MSEVINFKREQERQLESLYVNGLFSMILWVEEETGLDVAFIKRHMFEYFRIRELREIRHHEFADAVYFLLLMGESRGSVQHSQQYISR